MALLVCKLIGTFGSSSDSHCSNWEKVLNENDTPQNQQFLSVYTLEVPNYSKLEKSIGIQGKNSKLV